MNQNEQWRAASPPALEKRDITVDTLMLVELDAAVIVDGVRCDEVYVTEDITTCGTVRETCPVCEGVHLQLVLRQKHVHVEHLFCPQCARCFDACLPNGVSALKT